MSQDRKKLETWQDALRELVELIEERAQVVRAKTVTFARGPRAGGWETTYRLSREFDPGFRELLELCDLVVELMRQAGLATPMDTTEGPLQPAYAVYSAVRELRRGAMRASVGRGTKYVELACSPEEWKDLARLANTAALRGCMEKPDKLESSDAERTEPLCPVALDEESKKAVVIGKMKGPLSLAQFDVLQALYRVWPQGIDSEQELQKVSGHCDARGIVTRLRKDPDWEKVILLPGQGGRRGYRLRESISSVADGYPHPTHQNPRHPRPDT